MRAKEFIREFTVNVPVTINIPLGDVLKSQSDSEVLNPGVRYGEDGDAKWSPPLQQHLDTVKDSVGPTTEDPTEINPNDDFHIPQLSQGNHNSASKNFIPTVSIKPSMLG
jgi:hypothetical protein